MYLNQPKPPGRHGPGAAGDDDANGFGLRRPTEGAAGASGAVPRGGGLKLVSHAPLADIPAMGQPIEGPSDPRWVLALRVSECLEGTLLRAAHRDALMRVGRVLGLSDFDASLVIAIVQEQARRGYAPQYCVEAGEPQLRLVPLPSRQITFWSRHRTALYIALALAAVIALELIAVSWIV